MSTRLSGLGSGEAPTSINIKFFIFPGITVPRAGLSMPCIVRSFIVPPAISAPVLPQLRTALAVPSLTISIARIIEESFFVLIA